MNTVKLVLERIPYSDKTNVVLNCKDITAKYAYDFFNLHGEDNRIIIQDIITKELSDIFSNWHIQIFKNFGSSFKSDFTTSAKVICYRNGVKVNSYTVVGLFPSEPMMILSEDLNDLGEKLSKFNRDKLENLDITLEFTFDRLFLEQEPKQPVIEYRDLICDNCGKHYNESEPGCCDEEPDYYNTSLSRVFCSEKCKLQYYGWE